MKNYIENEAAYEAAISRNIKANARKTRTAKFLSTTDGVRARDFLFMIGEFDNMYREDGRFAELNPVVKASRGDFFDKMQDNLSEWGSLTDGQTKAVLDMIARGEARVAERAKAREDALKADQDSSGWVGTIGERADFNLIIRMVFEMEGIYGYSYLHVMNDDDGNVVIYKGTKALGASGVRVMVKATVKDHDIRDGVKQTKIARPKAL